MNNVAQALYRTKRTLKSVCDEFNIPIQDCDYSPLETCSHCDVWWKFNEMITDLDSNPICRVCRGLYGL